MVTHYAKEGFYQKLLHIDPPGEFTPEAIKNPPEEIKNLIGDSLETAEASGLYELCQKYSDISLNSLKYRVEHTCDIIASLQFKDIDAAKIATKIFVHNHGIQDINGLMAVIKAMHRYAVDDDDPRDKGGRVMPENYDYQPGFGGKYYNLCEIPEGNWADIENDVVKYIAEN